MNAIEAPARSPLSNPIRLVSIIIPVFNEEGNVLAAYERVKAVFEQLSERYEFECLFTDNHSADRTFDILRDLARRDRRVRVWRFSRNFGYQLSIWTGYGFARGDCAVQLDCDLQDPPELIPDFIQLWEQGYKVVYGVRRERQEAAYFSAMRKAFYRLVDKLSSDTLPHDAGDFRLVDRRILDQLAKVDDPSIYVRGRIAAMGFSQIGVPYARNARSVGISKFRFRDLTKLAIDAIVSHSVIPLRLATYLGIGITALAIFLMTSYVVGRLFLGQDWPAGFATLTILMLFNIGLTGLFFGIMGEYVARIYQQLKFPPRVLIEESVSEDD